MKGNVFSQTSCVILSAGGSSRMGEHKAFLKFDSERTFLQKITEAYLLAGIEQIVVVVNSGLYETITESSVSSSGKVKLVINNRPELGRFYSLQTGIKQLKQSNSCLFQNIDNPFTTEKLLHKLIIHRNEADVLLPVCHKKSGHPVLFNAEVVRSILAENSPDLRIDEFFNRFNVKSIEVEESGILSNINTWEDYYKAGFVSDQINL